MGDLTGKKSIKNGIKIVYSISEVLAQFKRDFGAPQSSKYRPELQTGGLWGNRIELRFSRASERLKSSFFRDLRLKTADKADNRS